MSTNLPRVHQKIFGEFATENDRIAQFGSVIAGAPLFTGDIELLQALNNWEQGWVGSTISDRRYPTSEETTGINKVITQQLAYLLQKGIPEWSAEATYFAGNCFCQRNGKIYQSQSDDNINNDPAIDTTNWREFTSGGGGDGDYVLKAGDTMTGSLTINSSTATNNSLLKCVAPNIDRSITPANNQSINIAMQDVNDKTLANFYYQQLSNGAVRTNISCYNDVDSAVMRLYLTANGDKYVTAPASDIINSIVTTLAVQKASTGYIKFGNGLLMQWGAGSTNNHWATITLPQAYTASNRYKVILTDAGTADTLSQQKVRTDYLTTSSFRVECSSSSSGDTFIWFAIGY